VEIICNFLAFIQKEGFNLLICSIEEKKPVEKLRVVRYLLIQRSDRNSKKTREIFFAEHSFMA